MNSVGREVAHGNFLAAKLRDHAAVHRVIELDADVRPFYLTFRRSRGSDAAKQQDQKFPT